MSDAQNYGNHARDAEKFAFSVVTGWVGTRGTVVDRSATPEPDFRIEYSDRRLGLGEVTTHTDPTVQAMWSNAFRSGQPQIVDLAPGTGTWSVSLRPGARINGLRREAQTFIDMLRSQGLVGLEVYEQWPRGEPADTARKLGIEHVASFEGDDDAGVCYYFMPSGGGSYGGDPDAITEWVEQLLSSEGYLDVTEKLLARDADERHVFLMADSATSFGAAHALRELDRALPRRAPKVRDGITHVWAVPRFGPR
ncbi:MAG TPA: hypothetical protein VKR27_00990, partial [Acidimicrobiales bacterium]|nr:hypothetical protein [Acidimicrobiales bacterium]